jgi:hypothetical protein
MSRDPTRQIARRLSEQPARDQAYVKAMKTNPRKAIIREMSEYWCFDDAKPEAPAGEATEQEASQDLLLRRSTGR